MNLICNLFNFSLHSDNQTSWINYKEINESNILIWTKFQEINDDKSKDSKVLSSFIYQRMRN